MFEMKHPSNLENLGKLLNYPEIFLLFLYFEHEVEGRTCLFDPFECISTYIDKHNITKNFLPSTKLFKRTRFVTPIVRVFSITYYAWSKSHS